MCGIPAAQKVPFLICVSLFAKISACKVINFSGTSVITTPFYEMQTYRPKQENTC